MTNLVTLADVLQGVPLPNSERLRMQKQAMAGRELAPADEALLAADMPRLEENSGRLAETAAMSAIPMGTIAKAATMAPRVTGGLASLLMSLGTMPSAGEAQQKKGKEISSTLPNGYTPKEIEGISQSTGIGIPELSAMRRSQVQSVVSKAAEIRQANDAVKAATEAASAGKVADAQADAEVARLRDQSIRDAKKREAEMPFRERYPDVAGALPAAGLVASAGLPFALRSMARSGTFMPFTEPSRVGRATQAGEAALKSGDEIELALRGRELTNQIANKSSDKGGLAKELLKAGSAAAAGGALAAEGQMFPDQYDAFNLPDGSPAQVRARERALSVEPYLERGVIGTLTGLSGYKAAQLVPARTPDWARAEAVRDTINARPPASPPPTNPGGGGAPVAGGQVAAGGGGGAATQQLPPPAPPSGPAYSAYDPASHGVASRQLLDEMLTRNHSSRQAAFGQQNPVEHLARQAEGRYASQGLPPVEPGPLRQRAQGTYDAASGLATVLQGTNSQITNPRLRQGVLDTISGKDHTLALPIAAGGAAALSPGKADAIERATLSRMVSGQDITDMSPGDLRPMTGLSEDEIGPQLDTLKKRAGARVNGRTAGDQIRAVKDRTSPTGHRNPDGTFAAAP